MANKANSLAHTKWLCKYHIVFAPKYRRKIIYNQYRASIQEIIKQLCKYKGGNIRRAYDARSRSSVIEYSTKNECVQFYGLSQRKKRVNDF